MTSSREISDHCIEHRKAGRRYAQPSGRIGLDQAVFGEQIDRGAGRAAGRRAARSARPSMPSARRRPMSRNSSAISARVSVSSVMTPWPRASTRMSQLSGRCSVAVACRSAVDVEPAVRARPDAGIFVRAPIDEIVPALGARPRMVGNLVGGKPGSGADLLRRVVERARECRRPGRSSLPLACSVGKRRVRLDGELIEREVLARLPRSRPLELRAPGLRRLVRPRIDQIERGALERRARDLDRRRAPRGRYAAGRARRAPRSSSACTPSDTRLTPAAR